MSKQVTFTLCSICFHLLITSFLPDTGSCHIQSTTMQLVSDLCGPRCTADRATTVFQARSLIDCHRRCTTQKNKCYASNFYNDTLTCEMYNFKPTTFTSSRENCKLFLNYEIASEPPVLQAFQIATLSWGFSDVTKFSGYIIINGNTVINTTSGDCRGFNLVELNMCSCSSLNILRAASELLHFDTYEYTVTSDNMATYIRSLPLYTVLIGVTADEPVVRLTPNAKSALLAIGVNVNGLHARGKVAFVAQIGQPALTVYQVAPPGGNNLKITVDVTGFLGTSKVSITKL